ncbi:MAG: UDP-N-acetylglucosamine--N-acetylmuramyl-(pentapeptide) pyrophosphoryl-undecaprenol N-acetylglucosamine transferase [Longimicrobiales bacterium]
MVVIFSGGGTGGHLYPALSIAKALEELRPDVDPHFVGAGRGLEARVLPERGLAHTLLSVEGLKRGSLFGNVSVLARLGGAVARSIGLFRKLHPKAVVLTGGYASAPAGLAGALLRLPIVIQEQNNTPGVTTKLMARWARQIHLAYPEAKSGLTPKARSRVLDTGNPIRPPTDIDPGTARASLDLPSEGRIVLVVGGSQGSSALNRLMIEVVQQGLIQGPETLLWATGPTHYRAVTTAVEGANLDHVRIFPYLDDMPSALAVCALAISRAGAMTTSEFLAWGVPAILIPLPTSAEDHQTTNAQALEGAGVAVHLAERDLIGATLWSEVDGLLGQGDRLGEMSQKALARARPDAARDIARSISELLPPVAAGASGGST